jgi:class 3 adenylate cyclase/predicted ATPase
MTLQIYIPQDRLRALARSESLPDRTNGAALFADISGFTPLTEALRNSLGPRRGAEELIRQLEAVYSALIAEIERYGGSVIDFAGDSMMCWFDEAREDDSETPAASPSALSVACGLEMQRVMRAFAKITLPDKSTTALSLKVAVASGPARRFVVGDPDIQLMDALAGATIARTATAEHLTQKGEALIDSATAESLGDILMIKEWREDDAKQERFAVLAGLAQPIETPLPSPLDLEYFSTEELRAWLPKSLYERDEAGQGMFLTEFRPCAAIFLRFIGIDYDKDEAETQLNAFVRKAQAIVARHDGTFLQITIGDKGSYAYINFGVLKMHEDDAYRAVKTALELRDAAQALDFLKPLQIGLTQGTLRVGANGGHTRKAFGAMGDDVNLAARLMANAAPGEILLSGHVYKEVESRFVFEPRAPLPMKGKAEPLPVFAVTEERKQRAIRLQEPKYALPMVGREQELGVINDKLEMALAGKAQVIGMEAEAGLGKSRLVAEVIRLAHKKGFVGYGGACQSDGVNISYLAWRSVWSAFFSVDPEFPLRKQMRYLEGEIEDRAPARVQSMPLLNIVLDLEIPDNDFTRTLEPQQRKSALHTLFEECLRTAAKDDPLLIVFEDLHWIDALSLSLLEDLAKMLVDSPVCFVLAYRPSSASAAKQQLQRLEALPTFTKIELHELNRAEAEGAIRAKLAQLYPARTGGLPSHLVDELMERAQGNPFYLEELLNFLHDRGLDPLNAADMEKIELPDSLHTLILSRIDQLGEREKTTLRVASVIGRLFRAAWLTGYYPALGELAHVKVDLDKLEGLDLTPLDTPEPELAYLFRHIILHEVTYESLPFGLRGKLHEQLARYLERQIAAKTIQEAPLLDTLVYHYTHSENKAKQRVYLKKAGEAALNVSAFNTATDYFARLLELTPENDPQRSALALQLAESHYRLGDAPAARAAIQTAQAAAKTEADHASALALLGEIASNMGEYAEAGKILSEAIPLARASNASATLCRALYALGSNYWRMGKIEDARLWLEESLALARTQGDLTRELFALIGLGGVEIRQGNLVKAKETWQEAHTRAIVAGNRERAMAALNNLGAVTEQEDAAAAQEYGRQALALAREIGAQQKVALYLINLAYADIKLGNLSAARAGLREGLTLALRLGALQWVVLAVTNFTDLAYAEGHIERALALYGLARRHPAWSDEYQRELDATLTRWALDPAVVEAGMTKGAELDWDKTIKELLQG